MVRASSLAQQVEELLGDRMRAELRPGDQLPPEHELAAELMVSRATIRSAVAALARQGLVVRRQGVGTFVSEAARLSNPLSEAIDFNHLIAAHGAQSAVSFVDVARRAAGDLADTLSLAVDAPVLRFTKVFTADGQPIVHAVNTLPIEMLGPELTGAAQAHPEVTEPLFDFLDGRLGLTTRYQLSSISAAVTARSGPGRLAGLDVPAGLPLLVFDEVGFGDGDRPLWHSRNSFPPSSMRFELVRHRPTAALTSTEVIR